ncbi:hypothetical protein V757_12055 [Pelistega indica]|uniref:Type VI secretion protein n=1 Tax=Pelistega indica TaxID=1414851 RepID=V8FTZ3_9BURK|nr:MULTISPECIES: type VI secretion system membrane subunit TssM [Pelistega]ETD66892.1 hypothetical protein V757_12055 [Pelistega indica]
MNFFVNFINRIFSFLFSRSLWTFVGLLILAWLIWFIGPSIAVGQWYPLEDELIRIYVISAIFGIWLIRFIWRKWREARLNSQLLGQLHKSKNSKKIEELPEEERAEIKLLSERFDEAIQLLKQSKFEGKERSLFGGDFSKQYLYQLPWYVFIGAPGSGKTTALINSGLTFPLAEKFGKVALKGVGGTKNCDWWFTDEAVLLDTAGRYTTHESDPTGDEQEWKGFLDLLTKYRTRQPINGVILTVSVSDLLGSNATDRAQHALVLKRRLQELRDELGIHFPVYVMVTKVDLLHGFEAYFHDLSLEEQAQVWGFTLPYEQSQEAGFKFLPAFDKEFTLLQERLFDALPDVLIRNQSDEQRASAYILPQQFANLRMVLGMFLADVFSVSKFESKIIPRGVYFTSGTQGGLSFDKVTSQLKQYLRIDGISSQDKLHPSSQGKSYFLKSLLQEIVFRESGLAGLNLKWEKRYRKIQWLGYCGVGGALLLALIAWGLSYSNNSQYIDYVNDKIPAVVKVGDDIKANQDSDVLALLPFLNKVSTLPDGENFVVDDEPMTYQFGLYQGNKLYSAAKSVYDETIKYVLVPGLARRVETSLRQVSPADLETSYEALRAYLMMYDSSHFDRSYMKTWLMVDLSKTLPPDFTTEQYQSLEKHIDYLLDQGIFVSPFPKDEKLIQQVRDNLDAHDISVRAYSRIKRILSSAKSSDVTVVTLGGVQAPTVFTRKSGKPLNEGVNALYSFNGYWNVFNKRIEEETIRLRKDDTWVLNIDNKQFADGSDKKLVGDVRKLYFNDYIKEWDKYLDDIVLIKPDSLVRSIEVVRSLSSTNSPLTKFIKGVANETTLLRNDTNNEKSIIDRAKDSATGLSSSLTSIVGPVQTANLVRKDAEPEKLEEMVDNHFIEYHELATSSGQGVPPPIDGTISLLGEFYTYLTAADTSLRTKTTLPPGEVVSKMQAEAGRLPPVIGGMLDTLSSAATKKISAEQQENVGANVNAVLGTFCRRAIAGRYPFANSGRDIAPNDFARFFAPGQMMDTFFQQNLMDMVDMSTRPWRFKPSIDGNLGGMAQFLTSFEKASVIRDVYFAAGRNEPSFKVAIKPIEMDASITQFILNVDGQVLTYEHGPQVGITVEWPGKQGSNQVSMNVSPQVGTSGLSTSGPWALNRLLDRARLRPGKSPEVVYATFNLGGRAVTLEFTSYSAKSPFRLAEMRGFTCPGKN